MPPPAEVQVSWRWLRELGLAAGRAEFSAWQTADDVTAAHAPGIAQLAPAPYLGMNPDDARRLGLRPGDEVEVAVAGLDLHYPVRLIPALPGGVVGLPVGLPGLRGIDLPRYGRVAPAPGHADEGGVIG